MAAVTKIFNGTRRKGKRRSSEQILSEYKRAAEKQRFGSLGGASPVKKIDPQTGAVVEILDPETGVPLAKK
jgi:hypothetical protein